MVTPMKAGVSMQTASPEEEREAEEEVVLITTSSLSSEVRANCTSFGANTLKRGGRERERERGN